jgi:hypothetical protein
MMVAPAAKACYSGLVLMPTADVVGRNQYSIEYQTDGSLPDERADTFLVNTEVGLGDRAEIGVDFDRSSGATPSHFFNGKYVLISDSRQRSVAVGVDGVGRHLRPSPYALGSLGISGGRIHLGLVGVERVGRLMAGYDRPLSARMTVMADYTAGSGNASSVGFNYKVSNVFSVMAGVCRPNNGDDAEFSVHFVMAGPWPR